VVKLSGVFTITEASEEWVEVFVLPKDYWPDGLVPCGVDSDTGALELWIEPDGVMLAQAPRLG
jgi:hypothetical protein